MFLWVQGKKFPVDVFGVSTVAAGAVASAAPAAAAFSSLSRTDRAEMSEYVPPTTHVQITGSSPQPQSQPIIGREVRADIMFVWSCLRCHMPGRFLGSWDQTRGCLIGADCSSLVHRRICLRCFAAECTIC